MDASFWTRDEFLRAASSAAAAPLLGRLPAASLAARSYPDRTALHNRVQEHPEKARKLAALYQAWAKRRHVRPRPIKKPKT